MRRISGFLVFAAILGGCASWFMNGGKLVERDYAAAVRASYTVATCQMKNGSTIEGPRDIVFQVVQEPTQLALFERGTDGTGAVITNTWADAVGDHYFGWVQNKGWEYIIPRNPAAQAVRRVYVGFDVEQEGRATKPLGAPAGVCPLVSLQASGSAPPSGPYP